MVHASVGEELRNSALIFVILIDFFIFYSVPDRISFAGALIIIFGAVIVAVKEPSTKPHVVRQSKTHPLI